MVVVALLVVACGGRGQGPDSRFVRVRGMGFVLDEKPYVYAGVNLWQGAYLGADIIPGGKARLVRELDLMKRYGITNIRVTAATEKSAIARSVRPAFQEKPGQYNEQLLRGLDFLLDEMGKRGMKAVLVMGNYWEWSGGMAQYVSWSTQTPVIDPSVNNQGGAFMAYAATFYDNKAAWKPYFAYLDHVSGRTNTVNGKKYTDDPTIMSWQLANEPRPHPEGRKHPNRAKGYLAWVDAASKHMKKRCRRQLVSIGNEGTMGSVGSADIYKKAHAFKAVDYMTFHLWPKNWSWYAPADGTKTLSSAIKKTLVYIDQHAAFAKALQKPAVLEEFGLARDMEAVAPTASVTARDTFLKAVFAAVEGSAAQKGPLVGTNIWAWGGEGRAHNPTATWVEGTDFTGDPPQEPQGLNSIFDSDVSTLTIIEAHAQRLRRFETL